MSETKTHLVMVTRLVVPAIPFIIIFGKLFLVVSKNMMA